MSFFARSLKFVLGGEPVAASISASYSIAGIRKFRIWRIENRESAWGDGCLYGFHRLDYSQRADAGVYFDHASSLIAHADWCVGNFEKSATCRLLLENARVNQPIGWFIDDLCVPGGADHIGDALIALPHGDPLTPDCWS